MSRASEAAIRAEYEEWAGGAPYPMDDAKWESLRERVVEDPEAWWSILSDRIRKARTADEVGLLALAPLQVILECGGPALLQNAVELAVSDPKMATALYVVRGGDLDLYARLGRGHVVASYLRYEVTGNQFESWAWALVRDVVGRDDADEAWALVVDLIDGASDDQILDYLAASPLEDLIMLHAPAVIDRIERAARSNPKFKKALARVWIMKLPRELFDRVEAAAGVPLRRG